MEPRRHYKKSELKSKCMPKYFQVGTVIESATEFYTGRLTKKERKACLAMSYYLMVPLLNIGTARLERLKRKIGPLEWISGK